MSERSPSDDFADARSDVLEDAADRARLAPSVHNTQPWTLVLTGGRLALRADRSRQLTVLDPLGRELVLSVGAALLNARAALAGHGWATEVHRLPRPDDPDLLAEVFPVPGRPDSDLAALDRLIRRRHTNRRSFDRDPLPRDLVHRLATIATEEETILVELAREEDRQHAARLSQEAERLQNADPAYRAELRRWTTRPAEAGDGVPAGVVPPVEGRGPDELPIRDFHPTGGGTLPAAPSAATPRNVLLVATAADTTYAWLRAGEAMERLLLELTRHEWVASPVTQALEVPATREGLRTELAAGCHPQVLMRVGRAAPTISVPRRRREDVVHGSRRRPDALHGSVPPPTGWPEEHTGHRPVSDGRGGTIWI